MTVVYLPEPEQEHSQSFKRIRRYYKNKAEVLTRVISEEMRPEDEVCVALHSIQDRPPLSPSF